MLSAWLVVVLVLLLDPVLLCNCVYVLGGVFVVLLLLQLPSLCFSSHKPLFSLGFATYLVQVFAPCFCNSFFGGGEILLVLLVLLLLPSGLLSAYGVEGGSFDSHLAATTPSFVLNVHFSYCWGLFFLRPHPLVFRN